MENNNGIRSAASRASEASRGGTRDQRGVRVLPRPKMLEPFRIVRLEDLPQGQPSVLEAGPSPVPSSALNPSSGPLQDEEISYPLNYGSEESSGEEDDEMTTSVPWVVREFLAEEDEVNVWSPQPPWPLTPPVVSEPALEKPSSTYGPHKYSFEWKAFSESQIEPDLRRETFSEINSGPTVSVATPYEAFTAIWDRDFVKLIVREANKYAQQVTATMSERETIRPNSQITRWRDTTVDEIYSCKYKICILPSCWLWEW